jgi:hypothetical protein
LATVVQVNGGVPEVSKVKFSCKKSDGGVFLSWNGVTLQRGGSSDPVDPVPTTQSGGDESDTSATEKPSAPRCLNVVDIINSPLVIFGNKCFNVLAVGGTFEPNPIDLQSTLKDIQNGKPITVSGTYVRGSAKFQVSCTVDSSTVGLILPLIQRTGGQIDLAQVRKSLRISCATADGKHQFGIDGDDISGIDVDGNEVTVGGVKVNLAGIAHRIVNGKSLEVFGFTVKDGVLITPNGQSIKFDTSDVLDFLENAVAVVNKDGSITIAGDRGTITFKDGKVTFTGKDGKTHQLGEECKAPTRFGNALSVTCKNGQFSIDAQGKQVIGKQVRDVNVDANVNVSGYVGTIKKQVGCDSKCTAKIMAAVRAYLATKKCDAAANESSIIVTCEGERSAAEKNQVLDGSVVAINNSSSDVEPAAVEDRAEPLPARASAASLALTASAALVAAFSSLF